MSLVNALDLRYQSLQRHLYLRRYAGGFECSLFPI